MSLLRQRAIEASAESHWSVRRPALARAWFVSAKSWRSDVELNPLALQPSVVAGVARTPNELAASAMASSGPSRRTNRGRDWPGRPRVVGVGRTDMTAP